MYVSTEHRRGIDEASVVADARRRPVYTTRRRLLAAGGLLALGGLSGCVDRVAAQVTQTRSAPASTFGGDPDAVDPDGPVYASVGRTVSSVPATVSYQGRLAGLSGDIGLNTWAVSTAVYAQDYNTVRSNKRRSAFGGDETGDDDDGDDTGDDALDDALDEYLVAEPLIAEGFVVSLPDARVPRGGPAVVEEVSPRRILEYVTDRPPVLDGSRFVWGRGSRLERNHRTGEEDRCGPVHDMPICGQTDHLLADLTGPSDTGNGLVAVAVDGEVVVCNTPPEASDAGDSLLSVSIGGDVVPINDLTEWGPESGDFETTPTIVCPMLAQPPGCPTPLPALFHLRRCRHGDQYLYAGGWTLDETILFEEGLTLLTAAGEPEVVGVSAAETERDDFGRAVLDRLRRPRSEQGSCVFGGTLAPDGAYLPAAFHESEEGRRAFEDLLSMAAVDRDRRDEIHCVCTPSDGTLVHLDDNRDVNVGFKAGAELSKGVN